MSIPEIVAFGSVGVGLFLWSAGVASRSIGRPSRSGGIWASGSGSDGGSGGCGGGCSSGDSGCSGGDSGGGGCGGGCGGGD